MIAAEGEQKASKSLAEASAVMSESCAALQLRYLQVGRGKNKSVHRVVRRTIIQQPPAALLIYVFQTLSSISAEKNSTVIFPLPLDLIRNLVE